MPTYINNSKNRVTFQNLEWNLGESKALPYFVPYMDLGLTRVSAEPYVLRNNTSGFGSVYLTVDGEVEHQLPYSDTIELSVTVITPDVPVDMYIGDSETPVLLDSNNSLISHYPWAKIGYLKFVTDKECEIMVQCEPFTFRGTEGGRKH